MSLHQTLDLATKVLGIIVILFGGFKYFHDLQESRDRERREVAMSYVEKFNDRDFLQRRIELETQWLPYAGIIAKTESKTIPKAAHARLARAIALGDAGRRMSFEQIMEFLNNVVLCSSTRICDSEIIKSSFCSEVIAMLELYAPVIAERRSAFLSPKYAVKLEEFAKKQCEARLDNLDVFLN